MANTKAKPEKKRKIVEGIEHGLGGYTNYGCRCEECTEANSAHSREYRERRYAGRPLCIWGKCRGNQSRSHGNGLCWMHGEILREMRMRHPRKARRIEQLLGLDSRQRAA